MLSLILSALHISLPLCANVCGLLLLLSCFLSILSIDFLSILPQFFRFHPAMRPYFFICFSLCRFPFIQVCCVVASNSLLYVMPLFALVSWQSLYFNTNVCSCCLCHPPFLKWSAQLSVHCLVSLNGNFVCALMIRYLPLTF